MPSFESIQAGARSVCLLAALLAWGAPAAPAAAQQPDADSKTNSPAPNPAKAVGGQPGDSASPTAGAPPDKPVAVASSDLSSLDRLLPIGKSARKVTIPTVDDDGRLESVVTMGTITRVDQENFELEKVVLTSFDKPDSAAADAPPTTTVITLLSARYHAPTRVLVSDQRVTIRKPTLFLSGDSLRYDSATGNAHIIGKSYTLITEAPREEAAPPPDELDDDLDDFEDTEEPRSLARPGPNPPPTRQ